MDTNKVTSLADYHIPAFSILVDLHCFSEEGNDIKNFHKTYENIVILTNKYKYNV
jgi:hypothetical protein